VRAKAIAPGSIPAASPLVFRQVGKPERESAGPDAYSSQRLQEACSAARREGERAGYDRAVAEYRAAVERLARSVQELAGMRAELRREAEADLVRLALAIARRVLRRELAVDPDALRGLAIAALEKLQGQDISRVKVHPAQAALLAECLKKNGGAAVEVVPVPSSEPGAALFETIRGNLDASVDAQLDEIARGLADRLRSH